MRFRGAVEAVGKVSGLACKPRTFGRKAAQPCAQRPACRAQRSGPGAQCPDLRAEVRNLAAANPATLRAMPGGLRAKVSALRATVFASPPMPMTFAIRGFDPCAWRFFACARGWRGDTQRSPVCAQATNPCARGRLDCAGGDTDRRAVGTNWSVL